MAGHAADPLPVSEIVMNNKKKKKKMPSMMPLDVPRLQPNVGAWKPFFLPPTWCIQL